MKGADARHIESSQPPLPEWLIKLREQLEPYLSDAVTIRVFRK